MEMVIWHCPCCGNTFRASMATKQIFCGVFCEDSYMSKVLGIPASDVCGHREIYKSKKNYKGMSLKQISHMVRLKKHEYTSKKWAVQKKIKAMG